MPRKPSDKLKITLPADDEILFVREFDAPQHLVWEVATKPEHVVRWWNCMEGYTMPVCEIDLRVGGNWRYMMIAPDGSEVAFRGKYLEVSPCSRLVNTEIFEMFPDNETVVTYAFEARGDKTILTALQKCPSKEVRDAIVHSGMEFGAGLAYDRLDEVAQELHRATKGARSSA